VSEVNEPDEKKVRVWDSGVSRERDRGGTRASDRPERSGDDRPDRREDCKRTEAGRLWLESEHMISQIRRYQTVCVLDTGRATRCL